MISFNTIPLNLREPGQYIEIDNRRASKGLPLILQRALIIAPRLSTGTLAALTPSRVRSAGEAETFLGRGSIGADMVKWFKKANPYTDLSVIGVADDASGVAATGTVTLTGPATESGALQLYVCGERVSTTVTKADTASTIATNLAAAINAKSDLPVSAGAAAAVVTLTARNKGTTGNDVDVRPNYYLGDALPAGVTATIVAMASGATNPDLTTVTAAIGDNPYQTIVLPWTDTANLTVIENWIAGSWGGLQMKDVQVFAAHYGTYSQASTLVSARNSQFLTVMPTQKSPTPSWAVAALCAAQDVSQCESPANINRPRQTMPLPGMLPPKETDRYMWTERNAHLFLGASTYEVDDGGVCRIRRMITTYKTSNSVSDDSYLNIEDMRNIAYLRQSPRVRIALKYPRHKKAKVGTPIAPGQPIVTATDIRNELIALAIDWQSAGLVDELDTFKRELLVEDNESDDERFDAILPPNLINGFRVFAASVQFRK